MEIFFLKVGQKTFGTRLWAAFSSLLHYKWKMERSFHCCSMSSLLQLLRQSNTYAKKRCVSFQYRIAPEFFIVFIIVYVQRTPTGTAKLEKVWNLPYNRSNKTFLLFLYWWSICFVVLTTGTVFQIFLLFAWVYRVLPIFLVVLVATVHNLCGIFWYIWGLLGILPCCSLC